MRSLMPANVYSVERWPKLLITSRAFVDVMVEVRESRRKIEAELFRNRYHHSSKNDDDLPIVR